MLQSLLHHKLTSEENEAISSNREDSCTSSVFGLLQYLPDELFLSILKDSCGNPASFPDDIGQIQEVLFWKKFYSAHLSQIQQKYVEPDVIIETENYSIIIEAKKYDGIRQQDDAQWKRELLVVEDKHKKDKNSKDIIFIAIGGTNYSRNTEYFINNKNYKIHITSWISLSDAIHKVVPILANQKELNHQLRLLKDADKALKHFGHFKTIWLNTMLPYKINAINLSSLFYWNYHNDKQFEEKEYKPLKGFCTDNYKLSIFNISKLWNRNQH
jgi:hypothetical protein